MTNENRKNRTNDDPREQELREFFRNQSPPPQIQQAIRGACLCLPERLHKHRLAARGLRVAAASLAMTLVLLGGLCGLNAVNPAFAESLPLLGGIFRKVNVNGSANLRDTQENVQEYAEPLAPQEDVQDYDEPVASLPEEKAEEPVLTLDVPANGEDEQDLHITVEEAYYDGYFLYAGLRLQIEEDYPEQFTGLYDREIPGYDTVIDGEGCYGWNEKGGRGMDAPGFASLDRGWWDRVGEREYICQKACLLPEQHWNKDSLDVSLVYKGCFTYDPYDQEREGDTIINTADFALRFTAQRNDAPRKEIDCGGITMNGVTMVSAIATPAATLFVVDYDCRYDNPAMGPMFADGYGLGFQGSTVEQETSDGRLRQMSVFGGLREEEDRQIVWDLYDKNGSQQTEAVFIMDFNAGTITLGDADDVPEPANYVWYDPESETTHNLFSGDYQGEMFLGSFTVESGEGRWQVFGEAEDSTRHLKLEAYQDGALLGGGEQGSECAKVVNPEGSYSVFNGKFWAEFDPGQPIDVKVYEADTGEVLIEKTITMEKR